ncbi:MAG: glycosyltransferase [Lachnospiraceae bacterium]|nr:glycosyltransferase [Lachnospiraceae bacterium]
MRKILIITGRYLPGWRDGGPVRSIYNLTQWLGTEYDLRIMCLDRDHGDTEKYPGITCGRYEQVKNAKVWYTPAFTSDDIRKLSDDADVVYVCGPYGDYARMAMSLKKAGKIAAPLYIASMGSFSPEAFRIKELKKKLYILLMKMTHMFDSVVWSVTSAREAEELRAVVGRSAHCITASDLPRADIIPHSGVKEDGVLKLCFISRICRKKNLIAVPEIIKAAHVPGSINLDVYGVAEDEDYLLECTGALNALKDVLPGFSWEYKGEADSEKVPLIFAGYDAFLFPTLGENYGHVIAESLSAGCIPVISDTTPWLDLGEKGCGYVCPLGDTASFAEAVRDLFDMSSDEMSAAQDRCHEYIRAVNEKNAAGSGYRDIFG